MARQALQLLDAEMKLSPTTEAMAFRIWQYAEPLGWNCTHADVAKAIGETTQRVRRVCELKEWNGRMRSTKVDFLDSHRPSVGWKDAQEEANRFLDKLEGENL
jgi:hypothetical protein